MITARELFEEKYISRTRKSRQMYEEARHYLAGGIGNGAPGDNKAVDLSS